MRKLYIPFLLPLLTVFQSLACGGGDFEEDYYYNFFKQELVQAQEYQPFLASWERYYSPYKKGKNENIEAWQSHLGLSYEDAGYLVFKAAKEQIDNLIEKRAVSDKKLNFATPSWTKKHLQALRYLSYAKYLEPYMMIIPSNDDEWSYSYYRDENTADASGLDYQEVMNLLQREWNAQKDKELKLRYGYQMVRLAHYTRRYAEAVDCFNRYVASLNYRPVMYYYALSQYAGAERGLGNTDVANYLFSKVFSNTKNLKEMALTSINFSSEVDFSEFLKQAESKNEINDAYLLLGYMSFNNPVPMAEKIVEKSPNAIQAKVLAARAIHELEWKYNRKSSENTMLYTEEGRYASSLVKEDDFFAQTLNFALKMAKNRKIKDKNFWNLAATYLHFLNKDFAAAKTYLAKIDEKVAAYKTPKKQFEAYIYLCEQTTITPEVEKVWFEKYKNGYDADNGFINEVLSNRYFVQKEYAKSFMIIYPVTNLESNNIDSDLLEQIEIFVAKPGKTELEKSILSSSTSEYATDDLPQYFSYLWGHYYLVAGDLQKSLAAFANVKPSFKWQYTFDAHGGYDGFSGIPDKIFGYNQIECFECPAGQVMKNDYSSQFPFIKKTMNKKELAEALVQLEKTGEQENETGAKANYLLGNFFYNISVTGYYRHIFSFDINNSYNSEKFDYYEQRYSDSGELTGIANDYLIKAGDQAGNEELKARIAFAQSKCYRDGYLRFSEYNRVEISKTYFAELAKYKNTLFYEEVKTHCKYFGYYLNNY